MCLMLSSGEHGLVGFSDSNWGSIMEFCHSISRYVFTLNSRATSWSTKKQKVVTLSLIEVEYIDIMHVTKEAFWLHSLLDELLGSEVSGNAMLI